MGLDIGGGDPAGDAVAEADLVPGGDGGVLAQDVVAGGGAAGDEADLVVSRTRPRAHVEVDRGGGLEAQLWSWVPGDGEPGEVAVGLDVVAMHPAGNAVTKPDLVPGGRGGILAQNVVAGDRTTGDGSDNVVAGAGSQAHIEPVRGGGQKTQLRCRVPGHGEPREVAVGLDVGGGNPAGYPVAELDLVPGGRGRVLAQDVVTGGGEGQRDHDAVTCAGSGTHVEAVGGRFPETELGIAAGWRRCPDHREVAELAMQLHMVLVHPAVDCIAEADLVPGGRGRVLAQDHVTVAAVRDGACPVAGRSRCRPHDTGLYGVGQAGPRRWCLDEIAFDLHVVVGFNPAGHLVTEPDLVPGGRGRVLAQNVVAGGGATGNRGDAVMCSAGSRAHVEAGRGGGQETEPGYGRRPVPGYGQICEVAVGLGVGGGNPAGHLVAEPDLVPGGRGRVLAQNVVAGGGATGDRGDAVMCGAGSRAHVEPVRGGGQKAQLRTVPGHCQAAEAAVGLYIILVYPAHDFVAADLPPTGIGRVAGQQGAPVRVAGCERGHRRVGGPRAAAHRHRLAASRPAAQPGFPGQ